jgi:hypothetical protein
MRKSPFLLIFRFSWTTFTLRFIWGSVSGLGTYITKILLTFKIWRIICWTLPVETLTTCAICLHIRYRIALTTYSIATTNSAAVTSLSDQIEDHLEMTFGHVEARCNSDSPVLEKALSHCSIP